MRGKPKKPPRQKDLLNRYESGEFDEDQVEQQEQFKERNKTLQSDKMAKTAELRAAEEAGADIETLPVGEVVQVHSLFSEVVHEGKRYHCVVRRTLTRTTKAFVVVGDRVRFRDVTKRDAAGKDISGPSRAAAADATAGPPPEGVIEQILPRRTVLTRTDSFSGKLQHPIVANADAVLIVASIRQPYAKWGLIDRMLVAAQAGGVKPIVCLNKVDLAAPGEDGRPPEDLVEANAVLDHYASMGIAVLRTSVDRNLGIDECKALLAGKVTVLAGHSGVGKSSLVRAVQPGLDIRVGEVSRYTDKGRHTTTSARHYPLDPSLGGAVIDTPGVKQFGLWGVTRENLEDFFPDVAAGNAPEWRQQSFERIAETLPPADPFATPK